MDEALRNALRELDKAGRNPIFQYTENEDERYIDLREVDYVNMSQKNFAINIILRGLFFSLVMPDSETKERFLERWQTIKVIS